jgi:O-antigen ligase
VLATRSFAYLSAVLSFAYIQRWSVLGIPTTTLEICLVATLIAYVVEKSYRGEAFPDPRRMPYFWPVVLLLVAATISVLVAPDRRAAAGIWKAYFLEPALIAYVLADILRARWELEKFLGGFFVAGIIVSVFNILFFVYSVSIQRPQLLETPPVAIYTTANATGLFLGPLLALAVALLLFGNRTERWRAGAFTVVALPAFVLSFSRGAFLALGVALVFLFWQHRRRLVLLAGIAAVALGALLVPSVRTRIGHEFNPRDPFNTINTRADLWNATWHMMRTGRHPLFGTGLSGFKHDVAPFKDVSGYVEDLIYPHNIVLNFWTETGLLGVAAVIWIGIEWARRTMQALSTPSPRRAYYLGVAAAGITILVHGLIDVPFFKNDLAFLTMALIGVQVAALRQDEQSGIKAAA